MREEDCAPSAGVVMVDSQVGQRRTEAAMHKLPSEILARILDNLEPSEIIGLRRVCKPLRDASQSSILWRSIARRMGAKSPIPALPEITRKPESEEDHPGNGTSSRRKALEWSLVSAQRVAETLDGLSGEPKATYRQRAHIDRTTCVKLVVGPTRLQVGKDGGIQRVVRQRWLITGAVDEYVRVWDLSDLNSGSAKRYTQLEEGEENAHSHQGRGYRTSMHGVDKEGGFLLSEIDTGADVTSIDAELSPDGSALHIAVGSYYSSFGSQVYVMELHASKNPVLELRGSLNPTQWCGTSAVSIRGDIVAVGTFTGVIHVYDWVRGWRSQIDCSDRSSTAALRLFEHHLLVVTRVGAIVLLSLPKEPRDDSDDWPSNDATTSTPSRLAASRVGNARSSSSSSSSLMADPPASISQAFGPITPSITTPGAAELLARFPILENNKPLLSLSFGECQLARAGLLSDREIERLLQDTKRPQESAYDPLTFFAVDPAGVGHYIFDTVASSTSEDAGTQSNCPRQVNGFPYHWPPRLVSYSIISGERLLAAAGGSSGPKARAVVVSSRGGLPPACSTRLYRFDDGEGRLKFIKPAPFLSVPGTDGDPAMQRVHPHRWTPGALPPVRSSTGAAPRQASILARTVIDVEPSSPPGSSGSGGAHTLASPSSSAAAGSAPTSTTPHTPTIAAAITASSSPSTSFSSQTSASPASSSFTINRLSHSDMLTEVALDDAAGLVVLATVRGYCWIADYSS